MEAERLAGGATRREGRRPDAGDGDLVGLSVGFQPIRSDVALAAEWNPELGPTIWTG